MEFLFVGNAAWIDFVNTRLDGEFESIPSFEALLDWSTEAGLLSASSKRTLSKTTSPAAKKSALRAAIALRAELKRAAQRMLSGHSPRPAAITRVNALLREHPRVMQLKKQAGGWRTHAEDLKPGPQLPLAAIAEDFADFVATADPSLLRRCQKAPCPILFYDTSRNHARRWCSMQLCGNRTKVARHRARHARGPTAHA